MGHILFKENFYYISPMIVLGMSAGHDRGVVLIKDGKILIGITQ